MVKSITMPRPEIILAASSLSEEKQLPKELVFEALEMAINKIARNKYGYEHDIDVSIDRNDGAILVEKKLEVVENDLPKKAEKEALRYEKDLEKAGDDEEKIDEVEKPEFTFNENRQITLKEAKKIDKELEIGEFLKTELPPVQFGRSSFQSVKQILSGKIRQAEREKSYEEFKSKVGEVVSGTVKRIEYGNVFIDINGKAEGMIRRNELIPREALHLGEHIRAYILDVNAEMSGPQILLSRSHPNFLEKLFEQEVPEIYDGIIKVMGVARDASSHAKIAVSTDDQTIDPVGACVGMRGSRIQSIVNELQGEKIDVILYSPDIAQYTINALKPTIVSKVVLDEEKKHIDIIVPEDQLSIAIGRKGQNVRLASQLTGWKIDIMDETTETEKRQKDTKEKMDKFIAAMDIDEVMAQLLIIEGFNTVEEIANAEISEITAIEGFEEEIANELQSRAKAAAEKSAKEFESKAKDMKVKKDLAEFDAIEKEDILKLAENGIKTLDDLADLAGDELVAAYEKIGKTITEEKANKIIMKAREHWFTEDEKKS